jgi:hypothetical protein
MKDVINVAGYVYELCNIMVIKLELAYGEKVLNVLYVTCEQIVHAYYLIAFFQKAVA